MRLFNETNPGGTRLFGAPDFHRDTHTKTVYHISEEPASSRPRIGTWLAILQACAVLMVLGGVEALVRPGWLWALPVGSAVWLWGWFLWSEEI